jgi:hypothetical protein
LVLLSLLINNKDEIQNKKYDINYIILFLLLLMLPFTKLGVNYYW